MTDLPESAPAPGPQPTPRPPRPGIATPKALKERSRNNLDAAEALLDRQDARFSAPAASRVYYALYQRITAYLNHVNENPATYGTRADGNPEEQWHHSVVLRILKRKFCRPQRLDEDRWWELYDRVKSRRIAADYLCLRIPLPDVQADFDDVKAILGAYTDGIR